MKKALIGIAFLFAGLASAQVNNPSNNLRVVGRINAPWSNTGNTTSNAVGNISIPAGSLGANGIAEIHGFVAAKSGNTGNCVGHIYISSTANSGGSDIIDTSTVSTNAGAMVVAACTNQGSASSQACGAGDTANGAAVGTGNITAAINSATSPVYINFYLQNSVAGDTCYWQQAWVSVLP